MVTIEQITIIRAPIERCYDLARSVEVHLEGNVHSGEQAIARGGVTAGLIDVGQRVTWRAKHFGVWFTLTSGITEAHRPFSFQDAMIQGPFRSMVHDHCFHVVKSNITRMTDVFTFSAPAPPFGRIAEVLLLRRYMRALLHERNRAIRKIAESPEWERYLCAS